MIWWFQVRSFILTLPPSNIDFVDAGGVSEKLCKIPDDFSKDKFLIDSRRADCKEFLGFTRNCKPFLLLCTYNN